MVHKGVLGNTINSIKNTVCNIFLIPMKSNIILESPLRYAAEEEANSNDARR